MSIQRSDMSREDSPLLSGSRPRLYSCGNNGTPQSGSSSTHTLVRGPIPHPSQSACADPEEEALLRRQQYYSRLDPRPQSTLTVPCHVWRYSITLLIPKLPKGIQGSVVTIFSIWATMMGTSVLTMPWAIIMAGLCGGLILMVVFSGLAFYTADLVVDSANDLKESGNFEGDVIEFSDVCYHYLGTFGKWLSFLFSTFTLLSAAAVYLVLMTSFLFPIGQWVHGEIYGTGNHTATIDNITDAYCPHPPPPHGPSYGLLAEHHNDTDLYPLYHQIWTKKLVPVYIIGLLTPTLFFESATFFTKLTATGAISTVFVLIFVTYNGFKWGINVDFKNPLSPIYIPKFRGNFPALTGVLALAFFIHNCIISILRNAKHPENNRRDLFIAFVLVTVSYIFVGVTFYITFPLPKGCIEDNLLNNFHQDEVFALIVRACMLLQLGFCFPLICFIFRTQILWIVYENVYPSFLKVFAVTLPLIGTCLLCAIFLPEIGTIIRYSGALCGFAYVFLLPLLVKMLMLREKQQLKWPRVVIYTIIILAAFANFIAQFIITFI